MPLLTLFSCITLMLTQNQYSRRHALRYKMESKKSSEFKKYLKQLKKLLNDEVTDIILFGSFVKGGFAKDLDIAIIRKEEIDVINLKQEIRKIVHKDVDIQILGIESIYSSLWLTLLKEGYSIKKDSYLHDIYKIKPIVACKYSLAKLTNVQKVQFERGLKNMMKGNGEYITRSIVFVPIWMKNELEDFLKTWNIYYEAKIYELLPVMRKEEFL